MGTAPQHCDLGRCLAPTAPSAGEGDDDVAVRVLALGAGHDTVHLVHGVVDSFASAGLIASSAFSLPEATTSSAIPTLKRLRAADRFSR